MKEKYVIYREGLSTDFESIIVPVFKKEHKYGEGFDTFEQARMSIEAIIDAGKKEKMLGTGLIRFIILPTFSAS